MKLFILLAAVIGMNVASANAGYVTGDKILFQADSTFVSAVFSKSLCLNGDTYEATINKCAEYRNRGNDEGLECVAFVKVKAFQPMVSTRQRCAQFESDSSGGDCAKWETVPFVQNPVRTVQYWAGSDDSERVVKTAKVTIPACGPASK